MTGLREQLDNPKETNPTIFDLPKASEQTNGLPESPVHGLLFLKVTHRLLAHNIPGVIDTPKFSKVLRQVSSETI